MSEEAQKFGTDQRTMAPRFCFILSFLAVLAACGQVNDATSAELQPEVSALSDHESKTDGATAQEPISQPAITTFSEPEERQVFSFMEGQIGLEDLKIGMSFADVMRTMAAKGFEPARGGSLGSPMFAKGGTSLTAKFHTVFDCSRDSGKSSDPDDYEARLFAYYLDSVSLTTRDFGPDGLNFDGSLREDEVPPASILDTVEAQFLDHTSIRRVGGNGLDLAMQKRTDDYVLKSGWCSKSNTNNCNSGIVYFFLNHDRGGEPHEARLVINSPGFSARNSINNKPVYPYLQDNNQHCNAYLLSLTAR